MTAHRGQRGTAVALRLALALGFLSAVADRFGLWGGPGAPGIAWGNWPSFLAYTATLLDFVPTKVIPILASAATLAEVIIAIGLVVGLGVREFAFAGGVLLTLFALAMAGATGLKSPVDYSVVTAAAAAFHLAATGTTTRRDVD